MKEKGKKKKRLEKSQQRKIEKRDNNKAKRKIRKRKESKQKKLRKKKGEKYSEIGILVNGDDAEMSLKWRISLIFVLRV